MVEDTFLSAHGINRRDFMKLCAGMAATLGLSQHAVAKMATALTSPERPPVIWIGAQECTGCTEALLRALKAGFDEYLGMNPRLGKDVVFAITTSTDAAFLSEYIPANLLFRFEDKQAILDEGTLMGRLHLLIEKMHRERRMLEIDKEIAQKVDEAMDKNQRDYYLHEQLHMISEELGEDDDTTAEAEEYRRKITALHLDEDREKKLLKEVDRLSKMQSSNQEGTVIRTYLDTCLDLPWNTFTEAMQPGRRHARLDAQDMAQLTTPERIDRMRALRAQRNAEADRRGDATKALYAALTPAQQKTFDEHAHRMQRQHGARAGHGEHHGHHHGGGTGDGPRSERPEPGRAAP